MIDHDMLLDESDGALYNSIAPCWERLRSHARPWWRAYRAFVPEGARVLDVGCGNGRLLEVFRDHGVQYTGIDVSSAMIDLARARYARAPARVPPSTTSHHQFLIGDMRSMPFADRSLDAVFCLAAFHHLKTLDDRRRTLQEFRRVLQPGGTLFLETWNLRALRFLKRYRGYALLFSRSGNKNIQWRNPGHQPIARFYHLCTVRELSRLVNDEGFMVKWCEYRTKGMRRHWYDGDELCCGAFIDT